MNKLESTKVVAPDGKEDDCARFTIEKNNSTFTFKKVVSVGTDYVVRFWIRSESSGAISILGKEISTSENWYEFTNKFKATTENLVIKFTTSDAYYIYKTKLEVGDIATDWTPAPEDIEKEIQDAQSSADFAGNKADSALQQTAELGASLEIVKDSIEMMVTDENGQSMMTQTGSGWTFNMGNFKTALNQATQDITEVKGDMNEVSALADKTNKLANDISEKTAYINMATDEEGRPCMELGKSDGKFKLRITNESIEFIEGTQPIAYITNQQLYIKSSVVTDEMQIGTDKQGFVWKMRANGNMGLRWKG